MSSPIAISIFGRFSLVASVEDLPQLYRTHGERIISVFRPAGFIGVVLVVIILLSVFSADPDTEITMRLDVTRPSHVFSICYVLYSK